MLVTGQTATLRTSPLHKGHLHKRRPVRRGRHFSQHLTCRSTLQKVQATNHTYAKSTQPSWVRKHPHLHMAAEMARSPAAPGLVFTAVAVKGFSVASQAVSNLVDRTSGRAEQLGAELTRQLRHVSENMAVQAEVSQGAFQEWKGLMNNILSEEASKIQAELDHASRTVTSWQQQSAGSDFQAEDTFGKHTQLSAYPLSLRQFEMPQLESGWLVDAVQQRFPEIGAPNAWPTSFSLAASSDSTSGSDDEEARSPSSLGNMASRLMTQARQFTSQSGGGSPDGLTLGEQGKKHTASPGTQFASMILDKAQQLTGQAFGVSNFTSVDSPDHDMPELSSRGSSDDLVSRQLLPPPPQVTAFLPSPDQASTSTSTPQPPPAKSAAASHHHHTAGVSASTSPAVAPQDVAHRSAAQPPTKPAPAASPTPVKTQAAAQAAAAAPAEAPAKAAPSAPEDVKPALRPSAVPDEKSQGGASGSSQTPPVSSTLSPSQPSSVLSRAPAIPTAASIATKPSSASGKPAAAGPSSASPSASSMPPPLTKPSSSKPAIALPSSSSRTQSSSSPPSPSPPASSSLSSAPASPPSTSAPSQPASPAPSTSQASRIAQQAPLSPAGHASPVTTPASQAHTSPAKSHVAEQPPVKSTQTPPSSSEALPKPLQAGEASSQTVPHAEKHGRQESKPTASSSIKVVRPEPTPNWRTPRPLTPPPNPVQQGHPLSAAPAASDPSQMTDAQNAVMEQKDAAAALSAPEALHSVLDRPVDTQQNIGSVRPEPSSKDAGSEPAAQNTPSSSHRVSSDPEAGSTPSGKQPTTAVAAALSNDNATVVIDSIPWGRSGAATAQGRDVPTQSGGGGSSTTGGSTGGGGGGSRPSGGSGGGEGGGGSPSAWQQWWVRLLLAGGGLGTVSAMSRRVREALQHAVTTLKSNFAPAKTAVESAAEEQQPGEEEAEPPGIETNVTVKEGDTAWSIAEEYTGTGTAWPDVVASNPNVDTAKPATGTTLRVRVRL